MGIGSCLEYYDFILYGMLANYLSKVFFPVENASLALMKTFSIFAIAYFIRPLGGILFGHLGDKKGRKSSFNYSILLMAVATLSIGLLPSYSQAGMPAALALLVCRLLQGIAQGAELPGAITLICESNHSRRGLHSGLLFGFVGFGAGLASLVVFLLTAFFTQQQIIAYAWRFPFLLGATIAIIAAYLRRHSHESPLFTPEEQEHLPVATVLLHYPRPLLKAMALILLPAVLIIFKLYFPQLYGQHYTHSQQDIYLSITVSLIFAGFYQVVAGSLSDYFGQRPLYITASIASALSLPFLFSWMGTQGFNALLIGMIAYQIVLSTLVACYVPLLALSFPTSVRYTGVAIAYNCTYSIAALWPIFVGYVLEQGATVNSIYWMISLLALPGIIALRQLNPTQKQSTRDINDKTPCY